jgi:hypothetical protein
LLYDKDKIIKKLKRTGVAKTKEGQAICPRKCEMMNMVCVLKIYRWDFSIILFSIAEAQCRRVTAKHQQTGTRNEAITEIQTLILRKKDRH